MAEYSTLVNPQYHIPEEATAVNHITDDMVYDSDIHSYYFDIPFEETLKRHRTKPNCNDFGEKEMREWFNEKDFTKVLNEVSITADKEKENIVREIYETVSR